MFVVEKLLKMSATGSVVNLSNNIDSIDKKVTERTLSVVDWVDRTRQFFVVLLVILAIVSPIVAISNKKTPKAVNAWSWCLLIVGVITALVLVNKVLSPCAGSKK